ncbi:MAG TPA: nuclear transport factor 2 family protein, partial [Phycicoccus sp.]|nr:nuclear transport factor 2 family protein [Phycicoccus sp.]
RSPVAHKPYPGADAAQLILSTVIQVFEDFTYHRTFVTDDSRSVVLEFSANVSGRQLKGIDMIRIDDDGKIVDFEVMVRPRSGLDALAAQMGERLAAFL